MDARSAPAWGGMAEARFRPFSSDEGEAEALLGLLNRAFPVPPGGSFYDDFPVWDPAAGVSTRRFGAWDPATGRLLGCALARTAELIAPGGGRQPVGIVGGVATDPLARGRGLARRLTGSAIEWLASRGVPAVALWGEARGLYTSLGFAPTGRQLRVVLGGLAGAAASAASVHEGWDDSLLALLRERRERGLRLTGGDRAWVRAHRHVQWRWLGEPGAARAAIAVGKGIDLAGIVHELIGAPEDLRALLAHARDEGIAREAIVPEARIGELGLELVRERILESVCLLRMLDPTRWRADSLWFWGIDGA